MLFVFIKIRHAIVKNWGSTERYKEEKIVKNPIRGGINYILFGYISEKRIEIKQYI